MAADIVTVLDREVEPGVALVRVMPPSCGRCETDGGHSAPKLREMRVRVPDHLRDDLRNGYRVRLGYPRGALIRAFGKLFLAPIITGATITVGTWRWVQVLPQAALWQGIIAVASAVAVIGLFAWRGGSEADLPVIADLLGGGAPKLQPVKPISVQR
ncbi:MAG: hypothetical protein WD492_13640 [Alkalispirochaeta sp.]